MKKPRHREMECFMVTEIDLEAAVMEEYKASCKMLIDKCEDTSMLDFIMKLLQKTQQT